MSSHPISVRNKSSKFTLTKKEFHEGINKIANNAIAIKNLNSINNYQSEFSQYKNAALKKKTKNNQTHNSNHLNNKGNNTINKSKKILNSLNDNFLKLFREIDLIKKNKYSNKTAIDSIYEKNKVKKSIYNKSIINSKSKEKNLSIQNKNINFKKPKKQNSKTKNLKINSTYEAIHTNEKNNTFNSTQRNILTSNNKKKSINLNNDNLQKKFPKKKNFKTFNPFHIKFSKPINGLLKNKIKQSNITTYSINFSKLMSNKINSLENQINKTQEIIHNTSKTKKKKDFKKSVKKSNNSNNNILNDKKIMNNKVKKLNNSIINKKIEKHNNNKENENKNLNELLKDEINNFEIEQNLSNIDIFNEKDNLINNSDDEEESENSGVLAYDEVRDIIIYYDMEKLEKKNDYLFNKDDYKNFLDLKKDFYLNFFFNNNNNINRNIKLENKKQKVNLIDNKNKNNFINAKKIK